MTHLLIMLTLSCPVTIIDNHTKEWNLQDKKTLIHAKQRCVELYPEAPCLKLFRKKDSSTYNAVCGRGK